MVRVQRRLRVFQGTLENASGVREPAHTTSAAGLLPDRLNRAKRAPFKAGLSCVISGPRSSGKGLSEGLPGCPRTIADSAASPSEPSRLPHATQACRYVDRRLAAPGTSLTLLATQARQVVCAAGGGRRRNAPRGISCLHVPASCLRMDTFWGGLPLRAFAAFGSILGAWLYGVIGPVTGQRPEGFR